MATADERKVPGSYSKKYQLEFTHSLSKVDKSVDIIYLLINQFDMESFAHDILSFLDEASLRKAELVSRTWNAAVKEGNLWEKLYHKQFPDGQLLQAVLQRKISVNHEPLATDHSQFKRLFNIQHTLDKNWKRGTCVTTAIDISPTLVMSVCRVDFKRIIFNQANEPATSIVVFNRWTKERECILTGLVGVEPIFISDLQLHGDIIFCSYCSGLIDVWDLKTKQVVAKFHGEEVPRRVEWVMMRAVRSLFISCFRIRSPYRRSFHLFLTIRHLCSPLSEMTIDKTEYIPNTEILQIEADEDYFVLFLNSFDRLIIQLRSTVDFHIIRKLEMSMTCHRLFSYHSGRLVTVSFEENLIKFWDPRTLTCKLAWPVTENIQRIVLSSSRMGIAVQQSDVSRVDSLIVVDLPDLTDISGSSEMKHRPNELFRVEFNEQEMLMNASLFDDFQMFNFLFHYNGGNGLSYCLLSVKDFLECE